MCAPTRCSNRHVLAATHFVYFGPERRLLRDGNTSGTGAKRTSPSRAQTAAEARSRHRQTCREHTPAATAGDDRNPHLTNSFMMGVGFLPRRGLASATGGQLKRDCWGVGYRPPMARESDMTDQEIRAAMDRHWAASDASDFEAEHSIYREDAVLEYPQSGERIRVDATYRSHALNSRVKSVSPFGVSVAVAIFGSPNTS